MITATYTEQELIAALLEDFRAAIIFSESKQGKFDKIVRKRTTYPAYAHTEFVSPKKNRWLIFFEARARYEIGENTRVTTCCIHATDHGRYVYKPLFVNGKFKFCALPPHFFQRYAERMGIELSGEELIKRFCERNATLTIYAFGGTVCAASAEGILMGRETVNHNYLFKTFLTREMAKSDQSPAFEFLSKMRDELDAPVKLRKDE